jgi:hypothetical protein
MKPFLIILISVFTTLTIVVQAQITDSVAVPIVSKSKLAVLYPRAKDAQWEKDRFFGTFKAFFKDSLRSYTLDFDTSGNFTSATIISYKDSLLLPEKARIYIKQKFKKYTLGYVNAAIDSTNTIISIDVFMSKEMTSWYYLIHFDSKGDVLRKPRKYYRTSCF